MDNISIEIDSNYTAENVCPNNWWDINLKRYRNWAAIVTLDENGDENRKYLKGSHDSDTFFQVADVKKGDILAFGLFDTRGHNTKRGYYIVIDINEDEMTLGSEDEKDGYTTIRKALKAKKLLNQQ